MICKDRKVNNRYLEDLKKRVLVFDGAMGTSLQAMALTAEHYGGEQQMGCNDVLVLSQPEAVVKVHQSFLEAGAQVIETNTFRSNRLTLAEFSIADKTYDINFQAAKLAKSVANSFSTAEKPCFVAGAIGPSGKLISSSDSQLNDIQFDELADVFREQVSALLSGGVDLLLLETMSDLLDLKAAVAGIQLAFEELAVQVPVQAQVTMDVHGKMLMGTDIRSVLAVLEGLQVDVIGLNCSTGPEHMERAVAWLTAHSQKPISVIPNAGLPINVDGEAVYTMKSEDFSRLLLGFVERYGVRAIGGCCGTRPEHIRALALGLAKIKPKVLAPKPVPALASMVSAIPISQDPKPFIIGERLNAAGSKAFKRLLLANDDEGILQLAHEQVAYGAHALDLNVALAEGDDEAATMARLVKKLSLEVPVPIVIDSVDLKTIEAGLKAHPGRCLINSVHFESGEQKVRQVFALAKKYSAMVVCLTIDEAGLAMTAERKLEIAQRYLRFAKDYELKQSDLLFDTLTFTLASGDPSYQNSARETLKAIGLIKDEIPEVGHILGVSNISFGLVSEARKVLNSVFLYEAIQAGLDIAIINPSQTIAYNEIPEELRNLTKSLIYHDHDKALDDFVNWFEKHQSSNQQQRVAFNPLEGLEPRERLKKRITLRIKANLEEDIHSLIAQGNQEQSSERALNILNQVLLPAMQEVGDAFGEGKLILPFVLQSAEVMKQAVSVLEPYLDKKHGIHKGKIVLATVYGDIHDIGKNLVKTILENNGYDVIDLGKQVPVETIIQRAIEEKADAIGLSALLVATSKQMQLVVEALRVKGMRIPVLIGGAAINDAFGMKIMQNVDGEPYQGGVFYCKDAFEGLAVMDAITDPKGKEKLINDLFKKVQIPLKKDEISYVSQGIRARGLIPKAESIPVPSQYSPRYIQLPLSAILPYLDKTALFRVSWGAKGLRGEAWYDLEKEFEKRLERMLEEAAREDWLKPQALIGYWPCQALDEELFVFDPNSKDLLQTFRFPRTMGKQAISLSDYFLEFDQKQFDLVGLQVVSVGRAATEKYGRLEAQAAYSEGYYVHGLAVRIAEAIGEYCSVLMRQELKLSPERGKRFSWGYPAAPDISEHFKLFQLLPAEDKMDMALTSVGQMIPEQSTAAIFVHHQAVSYNA